MSKRTARPPDLDRVAGSDAERAKALTSSEAIDARRDLREALTKLPVVVLMLVPAAAAAANGGYFASRWGWTAIALGWLLALTIGRRSPRGRAMLGPLALPVG